MSKPGTPNSDTTSTGGQRKRRPRFYEPETPPQPTHCQHPECKEPGVCWEPKPGFPDKIAGSKYDPKHDPAEIAKGAATSAPLKAAALRRLIAG